MYHRYGKVTFEVQSPKVAGMVTAVILIGTCLSFPLIYPFTS